MLIVRHGDNYMQIDVVYTCNKSSMYIHSLILTILTVQL